MLRDVKSGHLFNNQGLIFLVSGKYRCSDFILVGRMGEEGNHT